jgi:hypothetical protein
MIPDTLITIDHVRAAGLCVHGTRTWFARHGLDFRAFLRAGLEADTLLATGDAMAARVVEHARRRRPRERA